MPKIHETINSILNNFTAISPMIDLSEEVQVFCLELSSAIEDDLNKTYPLGDEILKLNDIEQLRDFATNLKEKNNELEKGMAIEKFFAAHSRHFHPKDYDRLHEVATRFAEKGTLDIDDSMWIMRNNESTPASRVELESLEIEKKNRLIKLGNLKIKLKK